MGSQRYTTDKVWLQEEEEQLEEIKKVEINLNGTPVVAKYVVENQVLGSGGFSIVKSGKSKSGELVAIKVINKETSPTFDLNVAKMEIQILRSVQHPNVVSLKDSFELLDSLVLVFERLDGELFPHLATLISYTEDDARNYIKQLVEAVSFLHSKNFVHRDLVPENILVKGNVIKLIGFSMACECSGVKPSDGLVGTTALQSPEVVNRQNFSKASDMWSIGVLSFALLSGKFPFQDNNQMRLNMKIRKGEFEFANSDWSCVSAEAKNFVQQLIIVAPDKRFTASQAATFPWLKDPAKKNSLSSFLNNIKSSVQSTVWNC